MNEKASALSLTCKKTDKQSMTVKTTTFAMFLGAAMFLSLKALFLLEFVFLAYFKRKLDKFELFGSCFNSHL